jgi:hypothetical protein
MDLDTALGNLQRIRDADGHGRRELAIVVHSPGGLGATPCVPVSSLTGGIDWDQSRLLLAPEQPLTLLQPEQVEAITASVAKGQSWHANEAQKSLRDAMVSERARASRLAALLGEVEAIFTRDDELPDDLLLRISEAL